MKTRPFVAQVAKNVCMSQEDVFKVFTACIAYGKEILAEGDEWRLPGLGKLFYVNLPPCPSSPDQNRQDAAGPPTPRKRVRCRFSAFPSTKEALRHLSAEFDSQEGYQQALLAPTGDDDTPPTTCPQHRPGSDRDACSLVTPGVPS